MRKPDDANWSERLRALGCRGNLPTSLTDAVVEAARRRPLSERYVLADGEVPGLSLRVGATGGATFWLHYRVNGARRRQKIGAAGTVTLEEARTRARRLLVKVEDGQDPLALARAEGGGAPARAVRRASSPEQWFSYRLSTQSPRRSTSLAAPHLGVAPGKRQGRLDPARPRID